MDTQPENMGLNGRRETLRDSTDARAIRTRSDIARALETLAGHGETITVSSIVREAGISRGTFYTHYSNLEELAVEFQADIVHLLAGAERDEAHLSPTMSTAQRRETIRVALREVVRHYGRYRPFYTAAFGVPIPQAAATARVEALAGELTEHMRVDALVPADINVRIAALFIAGGWTTIITEWVMGKLDATEEQVTEHMVNLAPQWLYLLKPAGGDRTG